MNCKTLGEWRKSLLTVFLVFWFCWTTRWSCVGTMSRSCFSKWGVGRNFIHRPPALHYTLSLFHIIHKPKHIITLWWPEFYTQAPPAPYTQATRQAALGEGTLILSLFSVIMKIMMIVSVRIMITLMIRMMTLKIMMICLSTLPCDDKPRIQN